MFSARKYSHELSGIPQFTPITKYQVEVNHGNAFDGLTGVFTAPVTGLYRFGYSAIGTSNGGGHLVTDVMKNGFHDRRFIGSSSGNRGFNSADGSWEMILFQGDKVKMHHMHGTIPFQFMDRKDQVVFYGKLQTEKTTYP